MPTIIQGTELDITKQTRLKQCEAVIESGLKTFIDVGNALLEIRDDRLYRSGFDTFDAYCREKWGFSRSRAHRLIEAAEVAQNLLPMGNKSPTSERQIRPLMSLPPDQQREAWMLAVGTAPEDRVTGVHVKSVVDGFIEKRPVSYHISDDSYEWYTPEEYIEAARLVMGRIDLDPASSAEANKIVKARKFYTKENDGLANDFWFGNVWLNPPYNMPLIEQFINRIVYEYQSGKIASAIVLTNNSTDTGWFHKLVNYPVCFTKGRIQFWSGEERLVARQGQTFFYLGQNINLFAEVFGKFGVVLRKHDYK